MKVILIYLAYIAGILAIAGAISAFQCGAQWSGSGMTSKWGIGSGCRVQVPDGRWLPADRVREIEITPRAAK